MAISRQFSKQMKSILGTGAEMVILAGAIYVSGNGNLGTPGAVASVDETFAEVANFVNAKMQGNGGVGR